jgi:hypothetical protein
MLKFEKQQTKKWNIFKDDEMVKTLNLDSSTITNKFFIITDFIERLSIQIGESFDEWFIDIFLNLGSLELKDMVDNINKLKEFVDEYIDNLQIDYETFVNRKKVKKGTILFEPNEIKSIIRTSNYLKIFSVLFNSDLKLPKKINKKLYNIIIDEIIEKQIVSKILNVVKTKTYRYNLTDAYMWEYLKNMHCKTIDTHADEIFNFIMNSIVVLCEEQKNPITYFVGVVDESVKWFLRSVYKRVMIYDDEISTEDIHSSDRDNLKTYSFNDTLGKLKVIAYEQIHEAIESESRFIIEDDANDKRVNDFHNRITSIEYISPLSDCLIFPLLSEMTDIPYSYFSTVSPEYSAILSVYIHSILKKVFKNEYSDLFSLLEFYPVSQPANATTYKIKNVNNELGFINIQQSVENFFGFTTKILPYDIMSFFVGRTSRVNFCNIYSGKRLTGIPLSKIEGDMIRFYTLLFAGKLNPKIEEMKNIMNSYF